MTNEPRNGSLLRRLQLFVSGDVQGVCFRMFTCEHARHLGLTGFVRNLSDGRVEVVAEGPADALSQLAGWCRHGPPMACVTRVEEGAYSPPTGEFSDFDIAF